MLSGRGNPVRRRAVLACLLILVVPGCTAWKRCAYESAGRDDWQKPDEVVAALGIQAGDRVIFFCLENLVPELESAFIADLGRGKA